MERVLAQNEMKGFMMNAKSGGESDTKWSAMLRGYEKNSFENVEEEEIILQQKHANDNKNHGHELDCRIKQFGATNNESDDKLSAIHRKNLALDC